MLPWFFPRHIFSDRQEAFVSAPRVRDSSTEMGKENRRFTSGRVLVCPFLFGSASVCVQIPYPRGLLSLKTGIEGSVLTCPLSAPPWSLASLWAGRRHLTDTDTVFQQPLLSRLWSHSECSKISCPEKSLEEPAPAKNSFGAIGKWVGLRTFLPVKQLQRQLPLKRAFW